MGDVYGLFDSRRRHFISLFHAQIRTADQVDSAFHPFEVDKLSSSSQTFTFTFYYHCAAVTTRLHIGVALTQE